MRFLSMTRRFGGLLFLLAWFAAPAVVHGQLAEPQLASAQAKELWLKSSDQILAGDFVNALPTLERLEQIEPGHEEVTSVITWMRKAQELAASREQLRRETYDYFAQRAQKNAREAREASLNPQPPEKSAKSKPRVDEMQDVDDPDADEDDEEEGAGYKWSRALRDSINCMYNARDEDEFRREPWLTEIVDHVLVEIEGHKQRNEWADALALFSYLQTLYPKQEKYEEGYKFCAKRAHIDFIYGPKGEWRRHLREVTPDAIPQILERLEDDYVEDVDLKNLCGEGIEHLVLLAQAESIAETFATLNDKDLVNYFVRRLQGLKSTRVDAKTRLRGRDVEAVFDRVLVANRESGLNLPEAVLVDEFVRGMLAPLDEFTSVIWPAEVEEFNKHTRGEFVGVGIQITQDVGKYIRVETPLEDSPAYKAGIKPGDLIMSVDGKSTMDMTINQAVSEITGEPGTRVTLTIKDGVTEAVKDYELIREQIKLRTVRGNTRDDSSPTGWDFMIDHRARIGYIRVSGFMDKTVDDLQSALHQLQDQNCRGLILDLRFNPGGLLTSAVKMSELFLDHDEPIVKTKGRSRQQNMEISAKSSRRFGNVPMIVLVNEYSASASEIVAGAVSGLKEACIIGTRSFGKGSVQNLIPIADNRAYLKLTTAYYYVYDADLPEDPWYCLHRKPNAEAWGVEPHIVVKVIPTETNKILRLRRERDLLKGKDGGEIPKEVLERRPTSQPQDQLPEDPDPDVDPQLETAMNIMRIKLLSRQPWAMPPREMRAISRSNMIMKESPSR